MTYRLSLLAFALLFVASLAAAQGVPDPDPELERKTFVVPEGFEVTLWAGDPQIHKPIQINFDEQGRLWVASSEVYPQIEPGKPATDKILVLEDTDGDGKPDKRTVFADGLLIPTGVVPGDGGCYVANSTELLHFKDTDGDGKADQKRVVLSGFGTEDTHHLLHTLRWGHDGQLYMNQSIYIHSHVETPWGVRRLNGGGIWRFRPETIELDVFCEGFVNSWGHHQDYWGQSFATDGAYGEGINYVFPGSVFVATPGAKRRVQGLNPGSPKHCGLEIVSGRHLPDDWQGNMLTNDFRAHRVCRFVVTEDASGYASRQEVEVIKSTHPAFRPIDVKMGPDGAIYIADWYNPIINHGEVDFRDPRRDHVHGRIWRVAAKDRPLVPKFDYAKASNTELLDALKLPEEWIRLWAKLELKKRGSKVLKDVDAWLAQLNKEDKQYEHHRLEALWVYQNINAPSEKLLAEVLASPDHRARAAAVRVASQWQAKIKNPLAIYRAAVGDEHPRVRLEAVRALARFPSGDSAKYALFALDKPMDKFLDFALWQAMRDLQEQWLPAVREGQESFDGNVAHLTFALKAVESPGVVQPLLALIQQNKIDAARASDVLELIAALGGPKELGAVLDMAVGNSSELPDDTKASLLTALVETSQVRKKNPAGDLSRVTTALDAKTPALQAAAIRAVGAWKVNGQHERLTQAIADDKADPAVQVAAVDALGMLGGEGSKLALALAATSDKVSPQLKARSVGALANIDTVAAANVAASLLAKLPEGQEPEAVLKDLLANKQGGAALAKALSDVKLPPDTAKLTLRVARASLTPSPELLEAIQKSGGLADGGGWKLSEALLQQLLAEVPAKGDAARGELVFRKASNQCLKCHAIGGAGGVVGPDLVSIGASAPVDYLIESLLEPNKKIKENYHSQSIITDEGKVITGIPVRETGDELVVRDADDKLVTIAKASIEERKDGRSLMPDGSVDALTRQELVDLVRFLSELGKVGGPYAIGNQRLARRFETLVPNKESYNRLSRIGFDTVATVDPTVVWEPAYSRVSGDLVFADLPAFELKKWGAESERPTKVSFVRTQIEVTTPGKARLAIGDAAGLMLWVDGKPTPAAKEVTLDLASGKRTLVVAINGTQRQSPVRLELLDEPGSAAKVQWMSGK